MRAAKRQVDQEDKWRRDIRTHALTMMTPEQHRVALAEAELSSIEAAKTVVVNFDQRKRDLQARHDYERKEMVDAWVHARMLLWLASRNKPTAPDEPPLVETRDECCCTCRYCAVGCHSTCIRAMCYADQWKRVNDGMWNGRQACCCVCQCESCLALQHADCESDGQSCFFDASKRVNAQ